VVFQFRGVFILRYPNQGEISVDVIQRGKYEKREEKKEKSLEDIKRKDKK
jgi:hypothetical protein